MKEYIDQLCEKLDNNLDVRIKEVLFKNGFDCDKENNFNLVRRVHIKDNHNNGTRELLLDDKVILTISSIKVKTDSNKITAYMDLIEPNES